MGDTPLDATSADQAFSIALTNKEQAKLLGVKRETPILAVSRSIHFGAQADAVYSDIFCLTDRYNFTQTLGAPSGQN